jgi:centromeric protein E
MDRIHVTVRARPLSAEDAQSSPWRISGNAVALTAQPATRFEFGEESPPPPPPSLRAA